MVFSESVVSSGLKQPMKSFSLSENEKRKFQVKFSVLLYSVINNSSLLGTYVFVYFDARRCQVNSCSGNLRTYSSFSI